MGKVGQIWLKCITVDLNMMLRDKNNIFETAENFHAEMAWNYPDIDALSCGLREIQNLDSGNQ